MNTKDKCYSQDKLFDNSKLNLNIYVYVVSIMNKYNSFVVVNYRYIYYYGYNCYFCKILLVTYDIL